MNHSVYVLATIGILAIVCAALVSCSSASTAATSQSVPAATQTAPGGSTQPSESNVPGRSRPGASGAVTQISGSAITLNGQSGQMTVDVLPSAVILKTAAASAADLQVGQMVTVAGQADASGNVAASRISIRPQNATLPSFTPPAGASPRPSRPAGTSPGGFSGAGNAVFGTIAAVNGNAITVTNSQSQQINVTIASDTIIQQTVTGSLSDVQIGDFVTAVGTADQSGNVQATLLTIGSGNPAATQ